MAKQPGGSGSTKRPAPPAEPATPPKEKRRKPMEVIGKMTPKFLLSGPGKDHQAPPSAGVSLVPTFTVSINDDLFLPTSNPNVTKSKIESTYRTDKAEKNIIMTMSKTSHAKISVANSPVKDQLSNIFGRVKGNCIYVYITKIEPSFVQQAWFPYLAKGIAIPA